MGILADILDYLPRQDQARVAQVSQKFNALANKNTSKLFKYKSKYIWHPMGNVCLYIEETGAIYSVDPTHELSILNSEGVKLPAGMFVDKKFFVAIKSAIEKGDQFVIDELRKLRSPVADNHADMLQKGLESIAHNNTSNLFKYKTKSIRHPIGNLCLFIKEIFRFNNPMGSTYELNILDSQGKALSSGMCAKKDFVDRIESAIKKGDQSVIDEFRKSKYLTAPEYAKMLQEALDSDEENYVPFLCQIQ